MPVKVKICGLSTPETMDAAIAAGADFVGLVFFTKSPRNVSLDQAARLAARARGKAKIVALIVDADNQAILEIDTTVNPDYFQAHGNESPARIEAITALTGKPLIKAIKVQDTADVAKARDYPCMILFDAKHPDAPLPGGNGLPFDWKLLGKQQDFMLSGGLNPANVAQAIAMTGATIVDVSSGVETAPGKKDVSLIRKFIEAAKPAR